jgi:hypothetical protein
MTTQDSVDYHAELFNRVSYTYSCVLLYAKFIPFLLRTGIGETRRSTLNKLLQTSWQHASEGTEQFLF